MNWLENIPVNYNVSLAFIVFFIGVLTVYMAYRCIRRLNFLSVISFALQLLLLTAGVLAVMERVLTIPLFEIVLIFFGIILPSIFLLADYFSMKKRIKKANSDVPLVEKIEKPSNRSWRYEEFIDEPDEWQAEIHAGTIAATLNMTDKQMKTNVTQQLSVVHKLIDSNAYEKALDIYIILSGLLNDNPMIHYNTAWLYRKNGFFEESVKYYKKALYLIGEESEDKNRKKEASHGKAGNLRAAIHFGYGLSLYYLQRYELAINQFKLAQKSVASELREADINIARCYIATGVLEEAQKHIKAALKVQEDNKLRYLLARLCYEKNEEMECKYQLETIVANDSEFTEAWVLLGKLYRKNKDWKNAQHAYKKITQLSPQDADSYYRLAVAQREEGKTEEALANFKFAAELMPDHSRAYYCMASIYDAEGKTDKAIECLLKSLEGSEKLEMAYNLLAEIYIATDRINEAIHVYEDAAMEHPESYLVHYNLGISLMMMKRNEEAVRVFRRAHKLTDDDPALYYNWASAVIGLKNYTEAARLYKEGLKLKSDDDEILFGLARVSALAGDVEAAMGFLSKAIEVNPDLRLRAKSSHDFAAYRTLPEFMELTKLPIREERKHA